MQSFHRSRVRIFFEVLCVFALAASFAGAWMQVGASALLAAASVAGLYGLVHAVDLFRRNPAVAVEPQRIELPSEVQTDFPAFQDADALMVVAGHELTTYDAADESPLFEPAAHQAKAGRPAKAPRKKKTKVAEPAPVVEVEAIELAPPAEGESAEAPAEEAEVAEAEPFDEVAHISHAPLFEPAPYARQQRAAFGRKAG